MPGLPGYGYAVVERGLAAVFGFDEAGRKGVLRGRIKHLQRLDLPTGGPGKGRKRTYTDAQICAWLIALSMEQFGIDPAMIVRMIKGAWGYLADVLKLAREAPPGGDIFLILHTSFMTAGGRTGPAFDPVTFSWVRADAEGLKELASPFSVELDESTCLLNLSTRLRKLDAALRTAQEQKEAKL